MSDPRDFDRDPSLSRNRYFDRISDGKSTFGWIVAAVIGVILVGLAAYGYRGTQTSSTGPATTVGESTRAPVPTTPPTTPVVPAPRAQ
jgi:hypothetical protein